MSHVIVVGTQWGDEGKGKVVDYLSASADVVARFQGGHNAGHTLVIDGVTYALSLLPSGIARPGKVSLIGNGVVLEPWALFDEIRDLQTKGIDITPDRLKISDSAPLVLPLHVLLDQARETSRGKDKIGTTGRGIGPAYEDKVARRGLRTGDLLNSDIIRLRLTELFKHYGILAQGYGFALPDFDNLCEELGQIGNALKTFPSAGLALFANSEFQKSENHV